MKIIISPAKKMRISEDHDFSLLHPIFQSEHDELLNRLLNKNKDELLHLYQCSEKTLEPVWQNLQLQKEGVALPKSPALLTYEGIAFQYMAPGVFSNEQWDYVNEHLRILSAMYGVLRPLDGIEPYRLEMQQKLDGSLYEFWGRKLVEQLNDDIIINLASKEYSKAISAYQKLIDIRFFEFDQGKYKEKGVYAKMARGAMVRWLAQNQIEDPLQLKQFDEMNYQFDPDASNDHLYVFVRREDDHD
ncbi:MAG: peroxide stress protein YaaA [Erysipelotrichaceae bacterium]|nr:peroxide stress protein YaaA [Erysipelotrichaceae bacterium]